MYFVYVSGLLNVFESPLNSMQKMQILTTNFIFFYPSFCLTLTPSCLTLFPFYIKKNILCCLFHSRRLHFKLSGSLGFRVSCDVRIEGVKTLALSYIPGKISNFKKVINVCAYKIFHTCSGAFSAPQHRLPTSLFFVINVHFAPSQSSLLCFSVLLLKALLPVSLLTLLILCFLPDFSLPACCQLEAGI